MHSAQKECRSQARTDKCCNARKANQGIALLLHTYEDESFTTDPFYRIAARPLAAPRPPPAPLNDEVKTKRHRSLLSPAFAEEGLLPYANSLGRSRLPIAAS
jgi:hypothetical protein